jgi:hypothetical protein
MNDVAIVKSSDNDQASIAAGAQELFVINLCASMTPMPAVPKNLKGFEKYKLYQVSRQEDGRRRFRLRLGFFTSEADAEWVLNSVRGLYPAAFTGCVTAEDLRFTGDALPAVRAVSSSPTPAPAAAIEPPVTPVKTSATPAIANTPATKPVTTHPTFDGAPRAMPTNDIAATVKVPAINSVRTPAPGAAVVAAKAPATTAADKPAPVTSVTLQPAAADVALSASTPDAPSSVTTDGNPSGQPFHVGRGIDLPEIDLELTDEYATLSAPAKPALAPSPPQMKQPAAARGAVNNFTATGAHPVTPGKSQDGPIRSATIISPPKVVDDYVPILDTTLTIRTLTRTEAEDPNRQKWFAVQLALSEQPINLDTMPKLDIFAAYTLYCVATMEGGTVKHALRLGFFRESVSAEAVMGYLKAFFNQPTINQISSAEFDRFADSKLKMKPAAAESKVVNLEAKRPVPPATKPAPAIAQQAAPKPVTKSATTTVSKPRIATPAPAARPQSFLSRLIGRQLD